jgi:hypothetical protein
MEFASMMPLLAHPPQIAQNTSTEKAQQLDCLDTCFDPLLNRCPPKDACACPQDYRTEVMLRQTAPIKPQGLGWQAVRACWLKRCGD